MKKILTLFMLFLVVKANAQQFIEVTDFSTGTKRLINVTALFPSPSNGSGVSKKYVDSADNANQALFNIQLSNLQNILNQKQNTLIPGNNIQINNNVISATGSISSGNVGSTPIPETVLLPETTWWKILQPNSYGTTYSNGTKQGRYFIGGYKSHPGVNFNEPDRPDVVYTLNAYNILQPNGSPEFTNEAAWDWTVETHYDNSGSTPYGDFEWHQRMYSTDGMEHRLHSIYVNKTNGFARHDFEGNAFDFMHTNGLGHSPFTYAVLNEAQWQLMAGVPGRIVGFTATDVDHSYVQMTTIGGTGFLHIPNVIDADGYGKFIASLPAYADNTTAKAAGAKVNQWYQDANGNVKIVK